MRFGINREIEGKNTNKARVIISRKTKNDAPLNTVVSERSGLIPLITKRFTPTGGVMFASSLIFTINTPNQTGSYPKFLIAGTTIGSVIRHIEIGSKNIPNGMYISNINARIASLESELEEIAVAKLVARPAIATN
jgi:hypothetical protein